MSKKGSGKFVLGAAIGSAVALLFSTKKGEEIRKEAKVKIDEFVANLKEVDAEDLKKEFDKKVEEIKNELADLDKEKALDLAKEKGADLKVKAKELVDLAKEKGTPVLKQSAEELLKRVNKASKEALKKFDTDKKSKKEKAK